MPVKTIDGRISDDRQSVTLSGGPDARPPLTFLVRRGDQLHWSFSNVPEGSQTRVAFSSFEGDTTADTPTNARRLFARPDSSEKPSAKAGPARTTAIESGVVIGPSRPGKYSYRVFLIGEAGESELRCFWEDQPTAMGGGEKSGKPVP